MAKRFTDTTKWAKQKFSKLPNRMKLVWFYLCDNCDHAGVWDINIELLNFHLDDNLTLQEISDSFKDGIEIYDDKLFIKSFIEFQYGTLNKTNRVHFSILSRLEKLKIKPSPSPLLGAIQGAKDKDKEKDMDMDKEKDKEGGSGGKPLISPQCPGYTYTSEMTPQEREEFIKNVRAEIKGALK